MSEDQDVTRFKGRRVLILVNWPRAIYEEAWLAVRMTFIDPFKERPFKLRGSGWMKDPHLRLGFFVGLAVFLVPTFLTLGVASKPGFYALPLLWAVAANLVWLGVASWSRQRAVRRRTS